MNAKVLWERWYPIIGAVAVTVACWFVPAAANIVPKLSNEVVSAAVNLAAIFIGFVATAASILLSINSQAVQFMKKIGKFRLLMSFLWWSVRSSFALLTVCVLWFVFSNQAVRLYLGYAWVFTGTWTLLATYRATELAMGLVHISAAEDEENEE